MPALPPRQSATPTAKLAASLATGSSDAPTITPQVLSLNKRFKNERMPRRTFIVAGAVVGAGLIGGAILLGRRLSLSEGLISLFKPGEPEPDPEPGEAAGHLSDIFQSNIKDLDYSHGVWLDKQSMLFGQTGESQQLHVAVGPDAVVLETAEYWSDDELVAKVDENGLVTSTGYGECNIKVGTEANFDSCHIEVADKWVAFTFDDGPVAERTPRLLDGLAERGVHVTFFVLGNMAEQRPEMLARSVAEGHIVGNHSYNHRGGEYEIGEQLAHTDDIITAAIGYPAALMRPPDGTVNSGTYNCGKPIIYGRSIPRIG